MEKRTHIFGWISILFFLFSCTSNKQQQYTYTEYRDGGEAFTIEQTITAANDSLAYVQALVQYTANEVDYKRKTRLETFGIDYRMKPVGFSIKNSQGEELKPISEEKATVIRDSFIHDNLGELNYSDEDERKAFAGAEFGMSIKEVSKLPAFKDYHIYENQLSGIRQTVGNETYDIYLLFGDDDELYNVIFTKMTYSNANALDTYIKDRVMNLKEVIEKAYGKPQVNNGYPSIFDLKAGMITWGYKWSMGTKAIRIGVQEKYSGSEYRMYGTIVNVVKENYYKAKQETEDKSKIKEASSMF